MKQLLNVAIFLGALIGIYLIYNQIGKEIKSRPKFSKTYRDGGTGETFIILTSENTFKFYRGKFDENRISYQQMLQSNVRDLPQTFSLIYTSSYKETATSIILQMRTLEDYENTYTDYEFIKKGDALVRIATEAGFGKVIYSPVETHWDGQSPPTSFEFGINK